MKTGIMGGTFNPIHNAHLMIADFAREEFGLDRILFMTSGNPPHKTKKKLADAVLRHKMMQAAIAGNPEFLAEDYEVRRGAYSYTADTLRFLKQKYPEDAFYFIIGGDSLRDLPTWYQPEEILNLATILAFARSFGFDMEQAIHTAQTRCGGEIYQVHAPVLEISSSFIRSRIRQGKSVRYLLPDAVLEIIREYHLYEEEMP